MGDALEIELGTSEVAFAGRHVRNDRYRIIFVRNALDSSRRTINMLPNPLSFPQNFRTIGHGMRYEFRLT
jgi:hypothetical protein